MLGGPSQLLNVVWIRHNFLQYGTVPYRTLAWYTYPSFVSYMLFLPPNVQLLQLTNYSNECLSTLLSFGTNSSLVFDNLAGLFFPL